MSYWRKSFDTYVKSSLVLTDVGYDSNVLCYESVMPLPLWDIQVKRLPSCGKRVLV